MPVTLRANCIGSLAAQALIRGDSRIVGLVLNTFANSFYLRTVNDELVFVTNRSLRSPITVNLDSTSSLDDLVKPMISAQGRGKEIHIGSDFSVDLATASSCQDQPILPRELSPDFRKLGKALRIVSFLLGIIDTSQSVLDQRGLAYEGVSQFVDEGVLPLRGPNMERRFQEASLKVVGLGSGFTPSGDDTLGGFLATYNSFAQIIGRSQIILHFASLEAKTSWVSAKLLDYMQRLILDDQMYRMIDSAATGNEDAVVLALEALFPRGHASGIDISAGAILALSLIRDIAFGKVDTEAIAVALGLSL